MPLGPVIIIIIITILIFFKANNDNELRLAEYVIAFYSPCDRCSYVLYHDRSEVSLIYIKACYVGVVYIS